MWSWSFHPDEHRFKALIRSRADSQTLPAAVRLFQRLFQQLFVTVLSFLSGIYYQNHHLNFALPLFQPLEREQTLPLPYFVSSTLGQHLYLTGLSSLIKFIPLLSGPLSSRKVTVSLLFKIKTEQVNGNEQQLGFSCCSDEPRLTAELAVTPFVGLVC